MAPALVSKLKEITPRDEKGRTKHRYHQRLTVDVGHPELDKLLHTIVSFMKASTSWAGFYRLLQRAHPKFGETMELALPEDD